MTESLGSQEPLVDPVDAMRKLARTDPPMFGLLAETYGFDPDNLKKDLSKDSTPIETEGQRD